MKTHYFFIIRHGERADQKDTKMAFRSSNLPPHDPPLRSSFLKEASDPSLDRCSEIVGEYLRFGASIFEGMVDAKQQARGISTSPATLIPVEVITSPLQRCVQTAHYVCEQLPSCANHKREELPFHCDVHLYEYLAEGLFTAPKPPQQSRRANEIVNDEDESVPSVPSRDCSEIVEADPVDETIDVQGCRCPIPYAYNHAGPHSHRCRYVHPGSVTRSSPAVSEPSSFENEDLKFIHERFPECQKAAEKRFEHFVDRLVRKDTPSTEASPQCTIVFTHQFGVLAMVSHLLRKYLNRTDEAPTSPDVLLTNQVSSDCTWREYVKLIWAQKAYQVAQSLSQKITPQFTPRVDTSSVSLIVVQTSNDGTIVCTPITVGEC